MSNISPMEQDIDHALGGLACPHMVVEFAPFECEEHGDLVDSWECEDCGMEFVPAQEAFEWREAAHELRQGILLLSKEHTRLKVGAAVLGIFTFGLMVGRR